MNFPGYHRWRFSNVSRNILKILVSLAWTVILPLCYVQSTTVVPAEIRNLLSFLPQVKGIPPLYIMAVGIYLLSNILAAVLFIFPMLRRWIESSDWHIVRFLLWWSQVSMSWLFYFACPFFNARVLFVYVKENFGNKITHWCLESMICIVWSKQIIVSLTLEHG